jgi:predicted TIM-barrel fold metal-dependent hydrolase
MPDDPRLGMFLDEWEENVRKGRTVGSLHEDFERHDAKDDRRFDQLNEKIENIGKAQAFGEGQQSGGAFGAGGTGRFATIPNGVPTPPPFQPQPLVAVNVEPPARSKRHTSIPPAVSKFLSSTVAKVLVIVLAASVGWLARHLGVAPAEAVKVEHEGGK